MRTVTGELLQVERRRNTASGNPQWRLSLATAEYLTEPDSVIAHAITPDLRGKAVTLTLNDAGRVTDIAIAIVEGMS